MGKAIDLNTPAAIDLEGWRFLEIDRGFLLLRLTESRFH